VRGVEFVSQTVELSQSNSSDSSTNEQSQEEADKEMGIGKAGEDLKTNSKECPSVPAVSLPSPCLSPGWGTHLPSSLQQNTPGTLWRPWGPVKDSPTKMKVKELGAAASFQKNLVTPHYTQPVLLFSQDSSHSLPA
jgi:hypothetical protein